MMTSAVKDTIQFMFVAFLHQLGDVGRQKAPKRLFLKLCDRAVKFK